MKKLYFMLFLVFCGSAQAQLIITQFYFASKDGDAPYQETFIQVYNNSDQAINLGDWYLLHTRTTNLGSSETSRRIFGQTKTGNNQNNYPFPNVSLPAHSYFLVGGSRSSMSKAEHLRMPYYPDYVFENFESNIQHGILVLSKSSDTIYADSLFYQKPLTMARVSDMLIYGTMTRYGAPAATNPSLLFPNQAPILGIVSPADKQWKFIRKQNAQSQYSVTGKSSDDFERILAIEKPAQSLSGKKYMAYEEFFFKFFEPEVPSNSALTGTHAIANYLNGWTSNDKVFWEYDHSADIKNTVFKGLQFGTASQAGQAQTPFFRLDKDSAYLFRAQIMPFTIGANDRKQIAMEVLSQGRTVIDTVISIMDAESNKWYTVWLPLPKLDSVAIKFKNTVVNQVVVDRYGLKDMKIYADTRTPEVAEMMKIREAVALTNDSALMIQKGRLVRLEGVVQSRNFSSSGAPEFVISDSTGYIRVVDNLRRSVSIGTQIYITGELAQSNGLPRMGNLSNFLVSDNEPVMGAGYSTVKVISKAQVNKPIQMALLTCIDTAMPKATNAERMIRFKSITNDTIKVFFSRNYCQGKATPSLGTKFALVKGFGYINQSNAPFTEFGLMVADSNDLSLSEFDLVQDYARLNSEGRPVRKGDYIVSKVKVESQSLRSDANANYIFSDATGFFSAYHANSLYSPRIGDEILIMGKVDDFNKQTQLSDVTFMGLQDSAKSASSFSKITTMTASAINSPARFDSLVYVSGYATPIGSGKTLKFTKGSDTVIIRLTQAFGIDTFAVAPVAGQKYNVQGYIGRNYEVMQLLVPSASFFTRVAEGTSNQALVSAMKLQLWPNPSKDGMSTLAFEKVAERQIFVTNAMGQVVLRLRSSWAQVSLNLSQQASGLYFVTVIEGGQSQTIKLVKE